MCDVALFHLLTALKYASSENSTNTTAARHRHNCLHVRCLVGICFFIYVYIFIHVYKLCAQTSAEVDVPDIINDNCSRLTMVIPSSDASSFPWCESPTKQTHTHLEQLDIFDDSCSRSAVIPLLNNPPVNTVSLIAQTTSTAKKISAEPEPSDMVDDSCNSSTVLSHLTHFTVPRFICVYVCFFCVCLVIRHVLNYCNTVGGPSGLKPNTYDPIFLHSSDTVVWVIWSVKTCPWYDL